MSKFSFSNTLPGHEEMKEKLESFLKLLNEQLEQNEAEEESAESHDEMAMYSEMSTELQEKIDRVETLLELFASDDEEEDEEDQFCEDCGTHTENEGEGLKNPMNLCGDCEYERWKNGTLPYKISKIAEADYIVRKQDE